jgi:multidrug transporter EmrE-like cation transporter
MVSLLTLLLCLAYAALNVTGAGFIKSAIAGKNLNNAQDYLFFLLSTKVIAGFFLAFLSALVFTKALSLSKFSLVMPIAVGINFVLTLMVGYFQFGEKLSLVSYLGIAMILSGILVMGLGK